MNLGAYFTCINPALNANLVLRDSNTDQLIVNNRFPWLIKKSIILPQFYGDSPLARATYPLLLTFFDDDYQEYLQEMEF